MLNFFIGLGPLFSSYMTLWWSLMSSSKYFYGLPRWGSHCWVVILHCILLLALLSLMSTSSCCLISYFLCILFSFYPLHIFPLQIDTCILGGNIPLSVCILHMFFALSMGIFHVFGTSFLSRDTHFVHCTLTLFYSFLGFYNMKKKKKSNIKKEGWERVELFVYI